MKFYIAVDLEGCAAVAGSPRESLTSSPDFAFARRQGTREASAAARGLFAGGATQVIVWDNHGMSLNLDYEALDPRCEIAAGIFPHRFPGLEEDFAGVLLIGYHSRDNVAEAVLAHTYSSTSIQWMKVNGVEMGEIGIDAAITAEQGVPVLLVASDDKGCAEAVEGLAGVTTVQTKRSLGWSGVISLHPEAACARIEAAAQEVASSLQQAAQAGTLPRATPLEGPVTLEKRFKRLDEAEAHLKGATLWERTSPHSVKATLPRLSAFF